MQQIVDAVPLVSLLDDPVPQMVEQLPDVMRFFDFLLPVPEQVIEVPKILLDDVPMRTAVRDTQLAEQLVAVPTIVSYSWLQLRMEQNVDPPVPGRGGGISGLQGFLPGQSSTAHHGSLERISERIVEQNVEFPVGGGLQDFLAGQSSSASSHDPAGVHEALDGPGEGFFRTFHQNKKSATLGSRSGSELLPESSPSTPAAHVDTWVDGDDVWIRIDSVHGPFLEEVAVGPRSVAPAVGTALTAVRWLRGGGSGGYGLCDPSATSSSSLRRTVDGASLLGVHPVAVH